jgi:hypothetical protein
VLLEDWLRRPTRERIFDNLMRLVKIIAARKINSSSETLTGRSAGRQYGPDRLILLPAWRTLTPRGLNDNTDRVGLSWCR